jgi:hypothetical protein
LLGLILLQYSPNAAAYFTTTSGVRVSPTMPRMPEMETMRDIRVQGSRFRIASQCREGRKEMQ